MATVGLLDQACRLEVRGRECRPIVIGQLHNGPQGLPWPAGEGSDANHAGALSGWHHPLLDEPHGHSGANQWLIDDSQGQLRMRLSSYSASHGHTELSLGTDAAIQEIQVERLAANEHQAKGFGNR